MFSFGPKHTYSAKKGFLTWIQKKSNKKVVIESEYVSFLILLIIQGVSYEWDIL